MSARHLRLLHSASLWALGVLAHAGCSSSAATSAAVTHPTMIEVSPENFLGDVPCSQGPGLKRYVATLFDTNYAAQGGAGSLDPEGDATAGAGPDFQLPSSLPTPCLAAVGFGLVVPGRHYQVKIDGYDTDELAPRASGSRQMVSIADPSSPLATPRWRAQCESAIALDSTIVRADHCTTFSVGDDDALGRVRIPLGKLLEGLRCGADAGQVDRFSVRLDVGEGEPLVQTVPCNTAAEALFSDVAPRRRVSAYVTALGADGSDAFAGATCNAFTVPENSVDAECTRLSEVGTLRVDLQAALAQLDLGCDDRIFGVTVNVPGTKAERSFPPPDCRQPFNYGFVAGAAVVTVTVLESDGTTSSLTCGATVTPGQLALAECTVNPGP